MEFRISSMGYLLQICSSIISYVRFDSTKGVILPKLKSNIIRRV